MLFTLLLLQMVGDIAPMRIDLLDIRPACPVDASSDIVVCAPDRDADRLKVLPPSPRLGPPDGPLSFRLPGGGTGRVEAMQTYLPGTTGQGAKVTLRIPLGKRAKADPAE